MNDEITKDSSTDEQIAWLKKRDCDVVRWVPQHMRDGICRYVIFGVKPGHFLTALLSNDLMEAFGRADDINTANMRDWTMFLYNEAPSRCFGSPEKVKEWVERGGLVRRDTAVSHDG